MTARTIRRGTLRQKAPVGLRGGKEFSFENSVAARFLLDVLCGTNDFSRIVRLDWQAYLRAKSAAFAPASCSRRIPMVCSSVNLVSLSVRPEIDRTYPYLEEQFRGRSNAIAIIMKNAMTSGPIRIRQLLTRAAVWALEVGLPGETELQ